MLPKGGKAVACAKCTKKCLQIHRSLEKFSPDVNSFFKVMIGKDYSETMFLPPKFAPMVSTLIGQKAVIEDSNGSSWEVTVSIVDGSPAFQQGWKAFSSQHRLEIGYFLLFDYVMESHFAVKIYDHTGCEKLDFSPKTNQRKRAKSTINSADDGGNCSPTDEPAMRKKSSWPFVNSQSDLEMSESHSGLNEVEKVTANVTLNCKISRKRSLSVSKVESLEDPYYLIDRDFGDLERQCSVFDLSHFEMADSTCRADMSNKVKFRDEYLHNVELQENGGNSCYSSSGVSQKFHGAEEEGKAQSKLLKEIGQTTLFPMESDQSAQLKFVGQFEESTVQVSTGTPNCQFDESDTYGGKSSKIPSGVSRKFCGAKQGSIAKPKQQAEDHELMVSQVECTSINDIIGAAQRKFVVQVGGYNAAVPTEMQKCQIGESVKFIKKEPAKIIKKKPVAIVKKEPVAIIKKEPAEESDNRVQDKFGFTCFP